MELVKYIGIKSKLMLLFQLLIALFHFAFVIGALNRFALYEGQIIALSIGSLLIIVYFNIPAESKALTNTIPLYNIVTIIGAILIPTGYFFICYPNIISFAGLPNRIEVVLGTLFTLAILVACKRSVGWSLTLVVIFFLFYPLLGDCFPGFLKTERFPFDQLIGIIWHGTKGVYGSVSGLIPRYLFAFIFFGMVLNESRGSDFFMKLSLSTAGRFRGGAAKASILMSGIFGMVTGSVIACVILSGSVIMPMMRRQGYKAEYAAAVTSAGSCGAMLMPPVMGFTAFIMADFLRIHYVEVIMYSLLPAALYYVALFGQVHFDALKEGIEAISSEELPLLSKTMRAGWQYIIPLIVLIILLALYFIPQIAVLWATAILIVVSWINRDGRVGIRKIAQSLASSTISLADIVPMFAAVGIIMGSLDLTGLGYKMTTFLLTISGSSLFVLLVLTFLVNIILGMGLGGIGAYILLAILVAPALEKAGIPLIVAHMFIFYTSLVGNLTPPVAIASYVAAGMSNASMWKTGILGFRLSIVTFIVAFAFAYSPSLLLIGTINNTLHAAFTAIIGALCLAAGLSGYMLRSLDWIDRIILVISAIFFITMGFVTDLIGLGLLTISICRQLFRRYREPKGPF